MPVRSTRARTTVAANRSAGTSLNMPPKRPTAVRSGSQMTASRFLSMVCGPPDRELGVAAPLRGGRLALACGDDRRVDLLAHLGEGDGAIDDAARVEVDVPVHAGEDPT